MKKIMLVSVFVMNVLSGQVFASEGDNISRKVKEAFKKEFPSAEFAKWEKIDDGEVCLVRFLYNDEAYIAYFDEQGAIIASARLVARENLPYMVDRTIRKMYNDSEIAKVEELTMNKELSYIFTIDKERSRIILRVYSNGTFQKIKTEEKKSYSHRD